MKQESPWVSLCAAADVTESMRMHVIGRKRVVVVKIGGEVKAFDGLCPHLGGPLERGDLVGSIVTCPLHGWRFDLAANGKETHGLPCVSTYPVRQDGDNILFQHQE